MTTNSMTSPYSLISVAALICVCSQLGLSTNNVTEDLQYVSMEGSLIFFAIHFLVGECRSSGNVSMILLTHLLLSVYQFHACTVRYFDGIFHLIFHDLTLGTPLCRLNTRVSHHGRGNCTTSGITTVSETTANNVSGKSILGSMTNQSQPSSHLHLSQIPSTSIGSLELRVRNSHLSVL